MRKVIKILLSVLSAIILLVIMLPILLALLLNVNAIQNFAVRKAGEIITTNIGTHVSMRKISIRHFSEVEARGFYVEDLAGDTLIYAERLSASLSKTAILRRNIIIGDILLDEGKVYLNRPEGKQMNIQDVLDTFVDKEKEKKGNLITLRDIKIQNTRFKLDIENGNPPKDGTDFSHLLFEDLNIGSHNLQIQKKRVSMNLYGISFTDASGFRVDELAVDNFIVDQGLLEFNNAKIVTPDSQLTLPKIALTAEDWDKFKDFSANVKLDIALKNSKLNLKTLSYFIPGINNMHDKDILLTNTGLTFMGTINNFGGQISNITIGSTYLNGRYTIKGVSDINNALFDVDIYSLTSDADEINDIMGKISGNTLDSASYAMLSHAGKLDLALEVVGKTNEFHTVIGLMTDAGSIAANADIGMPRKGRTTFNGDVKVKNLNAGHIISNKSLGHVSLNVKAQGAISDSGISVNGNVGIPKLEFNGYPYSKIWLNGGYSNDQVNLIVHSSDPSLQLDLDGYADMRDSLPAYNITLDLIEADMNKLGFYKHDSVALLSGKFIADCKGTNLDNINGAISINDLTYTSPADTVSAGGIVLTGLNSRDHKYLALSSQFADAEFISDMSYMDVIHYLGHVVFDYLPALATTDQSKYHHKFNPDDRDVNRIEGTSMLSLRVKEANNVAAIFIPGFSIAEGSSVDFTFDTETEKLSLNAVSDYVEYDNFFVTKLSLLVDNKDKGDSLRVAFNTEDLYTKSFSLPSSHISALSKDNNIDIEARLNDQKSDLNMILSLHTQLGRYKNGGLYVKGTFGPSQFVYEDYVWQISDSGFLYDSEHIKVNNLSITHNGDGLFADGIISANRNDVLHLKLSDLDISPISTFTLDRGYIIDGIMKGYADITSALDRPLIIADITLDNIAVNDYHLSPLRLDCNWDFTSQRVILALQDSNSGKDYIKGYYRPSDGAYMADIDIPRIPLILLEPMLSGAIADTEGYATVLLDVRNYDNDPIISGKLAIEDMSTRVTVNNTTYSLPSTSIDLSRNLISLEPTQLTDHEGNIAELSASVDLRNMANVSYNVRLVPNSILALNTTPKENDLFYGKVYTSGAIELKGDKMGLNINVVATTANNSYFVLPLGGKSSISQADFIVFEVASKENEEDMDILTRKKLMYERSIREVDETRTNININVALNVLPNTEVRLILDAEANNVVHARGAAALNMHINPGDNEFTMSGNYEITDGEYVMNIPGFINNRRFTIQPGSSIVWTGEPNDAMLNIKALYKLRASLPESFTTGMNRNLGRIPVECSVNISNHLSQPDITFEVNAPNADVDIQNRIHSMMATQENMAIQFVWLVALNSFYSDVGNSDQNFNIGSAGDVGLEFLTSNLSNTLSSMSDVADFTLRYRQKSEISSSELDIGFTTNIIDNKLYLEVEGNFDTGDNPGAPAANTVSGDAALTGVLSKSGNLRGKLFTRTIDRYDENYGLQESGLGVYYREDFNKFSDVVDRFKTRSANRKQKREDKRAAKAKAKEAKVSENDNTTESDTTDLEQNVNN